MKLKFNHVAWAIVIIYLIMLYSIVFGEDKSKTKDCDSLDKKVEYVVGDDVVHSSVESRPKDKDISAIEKIYKDDEVVVEPLFYLSDYERWITECIVMGEAEGESYDGKVLVTQCILNACLKYELQPSEVKTRLKYSGWNNKPSDEVKNAVKAVFDDGYKVVDECILYFYAPKYAKGSWHETQKFVIQEGGHRFFAERE